jgi:hypothetical protein
MRDASSGDKLKIALFGDLSLEEAMDLSRDRQIHLHLLDRRLGGPQSRSGWRGLEESLLPMSGMESRLSNPSLNRLSHPGSETKRKREIISEMCGSRDE